MVTKPSPEFDDVVLPLRDRLPEYLAVFGIGFGVAAAIGLIIGLVTDVTVLSGISYTIMMLGIVYMLAGGASGGGYTNMSLGAFERMFSGRRSADDNLDDPDARRGKTVRMDPRERLRKGLRPEANPRAFWQVIAGIGYVAVGILLLSTFS